MKRIFLIFTLIFGAPTLADCRHALVLGIDVSGSVDWKEYRLQLNGIAQAITDPRVSELILSEPDAPAEIYIFEWSSDIHQKTVLEWTVLDSQAKLTMIANRLTNHTKDRITLKTAVGSAIKHAYDALGQRPNCDRQTIDISGDGITNDGPSPKDVYNVLDFGQIAVNALVVSDVDNPLDARKNAFIKRQREELRRYFESEVIRGPASFAMIAIGFEEYKEVMTRKLLRELSPINLSLSPTLKTKKPI